ncbi:MAG: carotenoid 1,2-hydratase [Chloroflexota bacterium]|nr:carotenoid 1,2-hydratase [Chloroflexota bacterium]MDE2931574.1 carotenoid 1,2-hydratase [Chloroflexota bacterium]
MNRRYVNSRLLWSGLIVTMLALLVFSVMRVSTQPSQPIGAETIVVAAELNDDGFARAVKPWQWEFPHDHGPHPAFQTEWWYYTGNLTTADGKRFGYQFTIFRRALTTDRRDSQSEWYTNQVYLAHFTVSDIAGGTFFQEDRFSRGAVGLAGAEVSPRFRVWIDDWAVFASDDVVSQMVIRAKAAGFALDLTLTPVKGPSFHGENGLSRKGPEPGNASYYYSLSRLETTGIVEIGGEEFAVSGLSWMDREFGTSALSADAVGWDWFAIHLDDGRDIMVGQIRRQDGSLEPLFGGLLVSPDGTTRSLAAEDFAITPLGSWQSKNSGATYPAGWEIELTLGNASLRLKLEPLLADQEVLANVIYWEGAVRVSGDASGYGYAELTGYAQPLRGLI